MFWVAVDEEAALNVDEVFFFFFFFERERRVSRSRGESSFFFFKASPFASSLSLFLFYASTSTHLGVQPTAGHVAGEHAREHGVRVLLGKKFKGGEGRKVSERKGDLMLLGLKRRRCCQKDPTEGPVESRGPSLPLAFCSTFLCRDVASKNSSLACTKCKDD